MLLVQKTFEMMKMFLGTAKYKTIYNLPSRVKKTKIANAKINGNTVTVENSMLEIPGRQGETGWGDFLLNFSTKKMIDRLKKAFQEASDAIKEQAGSLGENAKERGYQLIEEWLQIFHACKATAWKWSIFR